MRTLPLLCGVAAAAVFVAMPATISLRGPPALVWSTAQAAVDVDINVFFTSLAPHGAWIPSTEYNYIWVPTQVDPDWSPYSHGHWVYTAQYGWYFVSDEPFASIVYHYGRWGYDPLIGWYWVPGNKFAGAWVVWRQGPTVVGWAPMPPQGQGYAISISINFDVGSVPQHYWRMVPANQFLAPQLYTVAYYGDRRNDLYVATKPAGTVIVQNNIVINNVINVTYIEQQTKQTVVVAKVETVSEPQQASATPTSLKAFIADLAPPDKSVAPAKVVAKADVQAPTKGQATVAPAPATAAVIPGVAPTGNAGAPATATGTAAIPGIVNPNNPACLDVTFAKANPKDCAPPANVAATAKVDAAPTVTAVPPNTAGPAAIPAPATVQGKATVNPNNARCVDATFAKNNPKDCAPAANAAAVVVPKAVPAPAVTVAPKAVPGPAATVVAPIAVPAPATVQGKAGVNADNRCGDATFAKNNPKTCAVQGTAAGSATPGPAAAIVPPAAKATGTVSVQGNAAVTDPRCVDLIFATANAKLCGVSGKADASAGIIAPPK